jgi:hypothetical protein
LRLWTGRKCSTPRAVVVAAAAVDIGGRTAYDTDAAALGALWARADLSYAARVAALEAGVAYTDATGSHTAILDPTTVFDDGAIDTLNGGAAMDWFFAHLSGTNRDKVTNVTTGEVVTAV